MYSFKKRGGFDPFRPRVLRSWSSDAWQTIQVCDGRLQIGQYWNMGHLNKRSYGSKIPYDIIWWIVFFRYHHSISFYIYTLLFGNASAAFSTCFQTPPAFQPSCFAAKGKQTWAATTVGLTWMMVFASFRYLKRWAHNNLELEKTWSSSVSITQRVATNWWKKSLVSGIGGQWQTFLWWNGCCILHFLTIIHVTSHNVPVWPGQMIRTP